jgi:hypothetical protein
MNFLGPLIKLCRIKRGIKGGRGLFFDPDECGGENSDYSTAQALRVAEKFL